jgi:Tfp pilus assembly protein PilO
VKEENKFLKKYGFSLYMVVGQVVGVLLLTFLAVLPLYNKASSQTADATAKQAVLASLQKKKTTLDQLKGREQELTAAAEKVKDALPTSSDAGRLFIQIDQSVREAGGTIKSVSVGGNSATPSATDSSVSGVSTLSYSLPVSLPGYDNLKNFIISTNNALRLVKIDSLNISQSTSGSMEVTIGATTYTRNN